MRLVDLTRPIHPAMQVYPGDPRPTATQLTSVAVAGFEVHQLTLGSQSGTHLDAPRHTVANSGASESVALRQLLGRGVIVDVTATDPAMEIAVGPWLAGIEPGDLVLFRADWDRFDGQESAWLHPWLSTFCAAALVAADVAAVGLDFASPDRHGAPLTCHHVFAAAGIPVIENLAHLADVDWPNPTIIALPLSWPGLDGLPVRAIACDLPLPRC
ncbi:MAG TPA: cyclase family protein [Actinomycetota bacterium]|nr:cyclase family protein [Actinomycetota bacterium]